MRFLLTLFAIAVLGCASSGQPTPERRTEAPPQPPGPVQPQLPPTESAPAPPQQPESPAEATGAYGPKTVVIDDPEPTETEAETQSLVEAARKAKEARAKEGEAIAVITDETLPEYATGELSVAAEKPGAAAAGAPSEDPEAEAADERGEEYWRERVRGARIRWRDLLEEITRLEGQVAELRQRFYAEDDGFYRDSQIKPAWDRALDRLADTQNEVQRAQENLTTILEEGRQAGALPGWLREGIEYEPAIEEREDELDIHEVTEPPVVDEDDGGNG